MDRIFFENVRCFADRQDVPLAPLTVLVGENSSGKSTVLALVRIAWDLTAQPRTPDFNEEPFLLGAYEQIVGSGSGADSFTVGLGTAEKSTYRGVFEPRNGQPALRGWSWESRDHHRVELRIDEDRLVEVKAEPRGRFNDALLQAFLDGAPTRAAMDALFEVSGARKGLAGTAPEWIAERRLLGTRPRALAPIRTKPQRTYDPVSQAENPEGAHVPMLLASSALREPKSWKAIVSSLEGFGKQAGLFDRIRVRRLGKGEGDPFQLQIHLGGKTVNLMDVGYGVSQVLPIVVDCLRSPKGSVFLLQQPEVHLHPRAQAELASFLGVLAKTQGKRFIIETHSDYLVDRLRMDVRDGKGGLAPEDISLLYFERSNGKAQIHRIELDRMGNLLNPPPGYRSFFLEEERRFLGG